MKYLFFSLIQWFSTPPVRPRPLSARPRPLPGGLQIGTIINPQGDVSFANIVSPTSSLQKNPVKGSSEDAGVFVRR